MALLITNTNMERLIHISEVLPPTPAVWQVVTSTSNVVSSPMTREVDSVKLTDNGGYTKEYSVWGTNGELTFDIDFDPNNAVHEILRVAIENNTQLLVNVYVGEFGLGVAEQAVGQVTNFSDAGTDGGVLRRSVTIIPNEPIDRLATPAVVAP